MRNTLDSGELRARKLVLQKTVDKIEVGRDVARLHYKFPLSILLFKRVRGLEPLTSTLGRLRSTTELYPHYSANYRPEDANCQTKIGWHLCLTLQNSQNCLANPTPKGQDIDEADVPAVWLNVKLHIRGEIG